MEKTAEKPAKYIREDGRLKSFGYNPGNCFYPYLRNGRLAIEGLFSTTVPKSALINSDEKTTVYIGKEMHFGISAIESSNGERFSLKPGTIVDVCTKTIKPLYFRDICLGVDCVGIHIHVIKEITPHLQNYMQNGFTLTCTNKKPPPCKCGHGEKEYLTGWAVDC